MILFDENADAELLSSAIDEAMARFSFNGSVPESNANYRGCQPYQESVRPSGGGFRLGPPPPLPDAKFRRPEPVNSTPIDPQQIIAQILSNKNRAERSGGGSSSNNSSSSRTGAIKNSNNIIKSKSNDNCDNMTLQSEYENVRPPMRLPAAPTAAEAGNEQAVSGKGRRRVGRQESRYTSGKVFIGCLTNSARIPLSLSAA